MFWRRMVARDGIEPPTPAFSGPRSTTELSGLSRDVQFKNPARIVPGEAGKGGRCPRTVRSKQPELVYQSRFARPNRSRGLHWRAIMRSQIALRCKIASPFLQIAGSVALAALAGCGPMPGGSLLPPREFPPAPRRAPLLFTKPICIRGRRRCARSSTISPKAPTCTCICPARFMPRR